MKSRCGQAGFSLIETMVAFTILAITTAALFRGVSDGTSGLSRSLARYEAAEFGRSHLDRLMAEYDVATMPRSGTYEDVWHWVLEIQPAQPVRSTRYADLIDLWDLHLTISDPHDALLADFRTTIYERKR